MTRLFNGETIPQSSYYWQSRIKVRTQIIYLTSLAGLLLVITLLPFIKVDVTVNTTGLVRPVTEKSELRCQVSGTVAEILVKDGQDVKQGQLLIRLQQDVSESKLMENRFELSVRQAQMRDLTLLSAAGDRVSISSLQSPVYRQQYIQFKAALSAQQTTIHKLKADLEMNESLFREKVIAKKEYLDRKFDYDNAVAVYGNMVEEQRSTWQSDMVRLRLEENQLHASQQQLTQEKEWYLVKAPVSGTLQQFTGRYTGNVIQAGEILGIISPASGLVAECYLSPQDIGYLYRGMPVKFQVDAFNYNEWGTLQGSVQSIDNDFTLINNQPVFKVRCRLQDSVLRLKNGISGHLRKGMTMQARFILTRRSLFQLLYDKTDNWINPGTQKKELQMLNRYEIPLQDQTA